MKRLKYLPILAVLLLGQVNTSSAADAQAITCSFLSPLRYTGTQWKVRSANGPVYLARWEGNSWRVLAAFDGTRGNYFLDWEGPTAGVYVALDSFGGCSERINIGNGR